MKYNDEYDMSNCGIYVTLRRVSEQDELLGRFVGEIGVFQCIDPEDPKVALVKFKDFSGYRVYRNDLDFFKTATIESILDAFNLEDEEEVVARLKKFIKQECDTNEQIP